MGDPSLAQAPEAAVPLVSVPADAPPTEAPWPTARRFAFRFLFCFAVLAYSPFPLNALPRGDKVADPIERAQGKAGIWLTTRLLHPPAEELPEFSGSGDILWHYVELGARVALALVAAALWSALDRRRAEYRRLEAWLRLGLRWALAAAMVSYGFDKVFLLQMPWDPARLVEPLGSLSPMGLTWTSMGAFPAYERFAGWGEVIGGLLLVTRRTAGLGAFVLLAVVGNVVAVNFCYDVPVKLYSSQLWLTAAYLAAPDALRLFRLMVLRRPTEPAPDLPLLRSERLLRLRWLTPALISLATGWLLYDSVHGVLETQAKLAELQAGAVVEGAYQVESFTPSAGAEPGALLGTPAWARVAGTYRHLGLLRADGSFTWVRLEKRKDGAIKLSSLEGQELGVVHAETPDPEHVVLKADHGEFAVTLKAIPESAFLLRRGYHWVQAKPINR